MSETWHEPEPAVADGVRECTPVPRAWLDTRILPPAWALRPCRQRGRRVGTIHHPHLPGAHQGSWDHRQSKPKPAFRAPSSGWPPGRLHLCCQIRTLAPSQPSSRLQISSNRGQPLSPFPSIPPHNLPTAAGVNTSNISSNYSRSWFKIFQCLCPWSLPVLSHPRAFVPVLPLPGAHSPGSPSCRRNLSRPLATPSQGEPVSAPVEPFVVLISFCLWWCSVCFLTASLESLGVPEAGNLIFLFYPWICIISCFTWHTLRVPRTHFERENQVSFGCSCGLTCFCMSLVELHKLHTGMLYSPTEIFQQKKNPESLCIRNKVK